MSSDWSDTMVWFGQILLYFNYCHPIYMILVTRTRKPPRSKQRRRSASTWWTRSPRYKKIDDSGFDVGGAMMRSEEF